MTSRRPALILLTLCLCSFAVNVDTTLVNIALPRLARDLGASTSSLQWIVDAYTLVFAALVLAMGSLGDRFGRRGMLIAGLVVYAVSNGAAALTDTSGALIAARAAMGIGAAMIFPTTLSILIQVFTERTERAKAIGLWGASTGLAVAGGPIVGGALLQASTWQSTFAIKIPLALVIIGLVVYAVPTSKDPSAPRLDRVGLGLSTAAVALLTYAIIHAPDAGWGSAETLALLVAGLSAVAIFIAYERRAAAPMLDLSLFADRRFSGASLSVTVAFFALAGFIFLIVQYFQFLQGYGPLEAGIRTLPVALSVGVASVVGTELAVRTSNKLVVAAGLGSLAIAYAWASNNDVSTHYGTIVAQMIFLGSGMGLTSAPATESIMGAVDPAKAGIGSAINDTARELGGTIGVAVVGSVFASLYTRALDHTAVRGVPREALAAAHEGFGAAAGAAGRLSAAGADTAAAHLRSVAASGFFDGFQAGCLTVAGVCAVGAVLVLRLLPARAARTDDRLRRRRAGSGTINLMPEPRSYRQTCGLAHVLDVVGERWTLLVVRELARGPKRFTDLETALPGIGANLLATRLKRLEQHDIIERVAPTPGASAYGLTATGEQLVDAMDDLLLWGMSIMDPPHPGHRARAAWAAMGMRVWMDRQPERPAEGTYAFHVDGERFWLRVGSDRSHLRDGDPPYPADATLTIGTTDFFHLAIGHRTLDDLDVETAGDARRLRQLVQTFRLPPNAKLQPVGDSPFS